MIWKGGDGASGDGRTMSRKVVSFEVKIVTPSVTAAGDTSQPLVTPLTCYTISAGCPTFHIPYSKNTYTNLRCY